ncbi:MAG: thioredoxin-disulfide reductase [Candidatus Omnitrophica bacterium]|nr:thioredoxin-disulfide reductase [Candidatus Omnitrophota bacterium]
MAKKYDVIIIGAGPAGLTAGIYCARAKLKTLVLEKTAVGGQLLLYGEVIENYPGFPDGTSGFELVEKMKKQAQRFGIELLTGEISNINFQYLADGYQVATNTGQAYHARAIIIATGANPKQLGVKGEIELKGKGVSYCATCDGPLFKNKEVVVVGGGDKAIEEAIYLTRFVKRLTIVHRRDDLRAVKILQEKLSDNKKIDKKLSYIVTKILGVDRVNGVRVKNVKTGKEEEIPASGVFIFVGVDPSTNFLKKNNMLDDKGFIITKENMETSVNGVFACGDARKNILKQVIVSCAEGAIAAYSCYHYIEGLLKD